MAYTPRVGDYFFYDWPREIGLITDIKGQSVKTKNLLLRYDARNRVRILKDCFHLEYKGFDPDRARHPFNAVNLLEILSLTKPSKAKCYKEFLKGAFLKLIED